MIYGLYLSAAGAMVESAKHEVIANNLANVNTTGFRQDLAVISARQAEARENPFPAYATPQDNLGGGVLVSETVTRHEQGPLQVTNNPFDLAISGEGFFAVSGGDGAFYTRAGSFTRDTSGRLAMPDGKHFLADRAGRPVLLPTEAADITVSRDGSITADGAPAGKIDTFAFADTANLSKAGANLFANRGAEPTLAWGGQIVQGATEGSGISPTSELSRMIVAMRSYEANMQMIKMQDQSLSDLISIGRVTF